MKQLPSSLGVIRAAALAAAVVAPAANAVNIAQDGIGEYAIAPLYTVRDGWSTLINLTNTRPYPIAVKVRFHEAQETRDVLDFNVLLSSYDVWVGVVTDSVDGPVIVVPNQENPLDPDFGDSATCTTPVRLSGTLLEPGSLVGLNGDVDRVREGYIEVIEMGHTGTSVAYNTLLQQPPEIPQSARPTEIGNLIQRHTCDELEDLFLPRNIVTTARQFGEPINALKLNVRLTNPARGMEVEGKVVTWANFFNGLLGSGVQPTIAYPWPDFNVLVRDNWWGNTVATGCVGDRGIERRTGQDWNPVQPGIAPDGACVNLVTAQLYPDYYEPSLNDVFPVRGNFWDDTMNGPNEFNRPTDVDGYRIAAPLATPDVRGADAFSMTIQRAAIINEWAEQVGNAVSMEWVVTFPTKSFYVDQGNDHFNSIITADTTSCGPAPGRPWRRNSEYQAPFCQAPYPPFGLEDPTLSDFDPEQCDDAFYPIVAQVNAFDRAENEWGDILASPFRQDSLIELCYEANLLSFGGPEIFTMGSQISKDLSRFTVDPDFITEAGWVKLRLDVDTRTRADRVINDGTAFAGQNGGLEGYNGLPVIGFAVKQRDFGDPTVNYTTAVGHGFERRQSAEF